MNESFSRGMNFSIKTNLYNIKITYNKKNITLTRYLFKKGFLNSFFILKKSKKNKLIVLMFSYYYNKKPIRYIKKISKPGRKIYISYTSLKKQLLFRKNVFLILSTDKGILNNKEAILNKVGGELLFFIKC